MTRKVIPAMQHVIGSLYANGSGPFPQSHEKAVRWWLRAAEAGHDNSQFQLGQHFARGRGVKLDFEKGVAWLFKSAGQGNTKALNELGRCYMRGIGVEKCNTKAVELFRLSAQRGFAEAQYNLAVCLLDGIGTEQDRELAVLWLKMAAANREDRKKYTDKLGVCYEEGWGVSPDAQKAEELYGGREK